jgi:hypothetical protein
LNWTSAFFFFFFQVDRALNHRACERSYITAFSHLKSLKTKQADSVVRKNKGNFVQNERQGGLAQRPGNPLSDFSNLHSRKCSMMCFDWKKSNVKLIEGEKHEQ